MIFGKLALACAVLGVIILLVLLERHAAPLVAPIMVGLIARMIHAMPNLGTDTWILLLALDAYLFSTFVKLKRQFSRKQERRYGDTL